MGFFDGPATALHNCKTSSAMKNQSKKQEDDVDQTYLQKKLALKFS